MKPSMPAIRTHVATSSSLSVLLPTTAAAHTPAGWGHDGTRKSRTSRKLQTWSVNPAAMAGVWSRHRHRGAATVGQLESRSVMCKTVKRCVPCLPPARRLTS